MSDPLPPVPSLSGSGKARDVVRAPFEGRASWDGVSEVLKRLFGDEEDVDAAEVEACLGGVTFDALRSTGLVAELDGAVRGAVRLTPFAGRWFASDRSRHHDPANPQWVVGPGPLTRSRSRLLLPATSATTLDLGCGSGALACLAADGRRAVTATDVNPRAVALTRFNIEFNGVRNVEVVEGDLFGPVEGRRFDRIMAIPPIALGPDDQYAYRDGGVDLSRRIADTARRHLTNRGVLAMWCNWAEYRGRESETEALNWFEGTDLDVWALRFSAFGPEEYARLWLIQDHRGDVPPPALRRWRIHLEERGISAVRFGLVLATPTATSAPWRDAGRAPAVAGEVPAALERILEARRFVRRTGDEALLDAVLLPSPDLVRVDRRKPTESGWVMERPRLRLTRGLLFSLKVDAVAAGIVERLGREVTPRRAVHLVAERLDRPPEWFLGSLPTLLRRLLERGLLVPAVPTAPAAREFNGP